MTRRVANRASAGFWAVAAMSLLWNGFGAYDYVMTNIRDHAYLAQVPVEAIDYFDEMPVWALAAWTLGVWGAVAGSLLLLLRSRWAVLAFAASLLGLAASTAHQVIGGLPAPMKTPPMIAMTLVIWGGALFFAWYSVRMSRARVLT